MFLRRLHNVCSAETPSPKIMCELWRTLAAVYTACVRAVVFTDTRNCSFVGAHVDSSCSRPPRILLSAPLASEQATPRQHNLRIDRESLESIPVSNRKRRLLGERGKLERNLPQLHVEDVPLGFGSGPLLESLPLISPEFKPGEKSADPQLTQFARMRDRACTHQHIKSVVRTTVCSSTKNRHPDAQPQVQQRRPRHLPESRKNRERAYPPGRPP